jgi:hypothetical protein
MLLPQAQMNAEKSYWCAHLATIDGLVQDFHLVIWLRVHWAVLRWSLK